MLSLFSYSAPVVMTPPTKTKKSSPVSVDKQQETEPVTVSELGYLHMHYAAQEYVSSRFYLVFTIVCL